MPRFEYKYAELNQGHVGKDMYSLGLYSYTSNAGSKIPVEFLNMLGECGWELIDYNTMLFRRKKS